MNRLDCIILADKVAARLPDGYVFVVLALVSEEDYLRVVHFSNVARVTSSAVLDTWLRHAKNLPESAAGNVSPKSYGEDAVKLVRSSVPACTGVLLIAAPVTLTPGHADYFSDMKLEDAVVAVEHYLNDRKHRQSSTE